MYRFGPFDRQALRRVTVTVADILQEVVGALPWLELALFGMLLLGVALM